MQSRYLIEFRSGDSVFCGRVRDGVMAVNQQHVRIRDESVIRDLMLDADSCDPFDFWDSRYLLYAPP